MHKKQYRHLARDERGKVMYLGMWDKNGSFGDRVSGT
jgi:hypothetical protein